MTVKKHHEQKNSKHAQAVYQGSVDTCEKIHNRHVVYTLLTLGEVKANLGGWAGDKTESRPVWQLYSKGNMYPWALEVLKLAEMNSNARQGRNHSDLISIWQTMAMVDSYRCWQLHQKPHEPWIPHRSWKT